MQCCQLPEIFYRINLAQIVNPFQCKSFLLQQINNIMHHISALKKHSLFRETISVRRAYFNGLFDNHFSTIEIFDLPPKNWSSYNVSNIRTDKKGDTWSRRVTLRNKSSAN